METARIEQAITRIETALARIAAAHAATPPSPADTGAANSARVVELVNNHEKLREEVADAMRDLDALIGQLEE
ncbi:MAG: hypothetical protein ACK4IS_00060 [Erythrobacter sp.]